MNGEDINYWGFIVGVIGLILAIASFCYTMYQKGSHDAHNHKLEEVQHIINAIHAMAVQFATSWDVQSIYLERNNQDGSNLDLIRLHQRVVNDFKTVAATVIALESVVNKVSSAQLNSVELSNKINLAVKEGRDINNIEEGDR